MLMIVRRAVAVYIVIALSAVGCGGRYGVSGPDDLGLAARYSAAPTQVISIPVVIDPSDPSKKITRNQILNQWVLKSDFACSDYQLQLSRAIRDARLGTDVLATVLSGLATIFAKPAVTHPLSGAATIALGVGGDIQSDLFLQQAGDVVSTAIQAVRTRARTELQKKWTAEYADYTLEQGLVDVQRYDRETCNLNIGLNEIRSSLNIAGPLTPQVNNPIIPLPRPTSLEGPFSPGAAMETPPPVATITVPPSVQKTPDGQLVFTPGKVLNAPAVAPPLQPKPAETPAPITPRPRGRAAPTRAHQASGAVIPPTQPPSPPVIQVPPTLAAEQTAFADAVNRLKHDTNNPTLLTPESRQIIDDCIQPMLPRGTHTAQILLNAGPNLPIITNCIVGRSR
jgi:hypothetical protein